MPAPPTTHLSPPMSSTIRRSVALTAVAAALGGALDTTSEDTAQDKPPAHTRTQVLAAVRRRVGQDIFLEALLDLWEGRSAVTGLAVR